VHLVKTGNRNPVAGSGDNFMTEIQTVGPGNRILRFTAFLFEGVAYLTFLFTILYAIGFMS
jgi:hypothetical protein